MSRNSPPETPWQIVIDPRLSDELTGSGGSFYHTLHIQPTASTSALATTSAFPTTASELQIPPETVEPSLLSEPSSQIQLSSAIDEEHATQGTPQDPRPCSAKGCKGTIPGKLPLRVVFPQLTLSDCRTLQLQNVPTVPGPVPHIRQHETGETEIRARRFSERDESFTSS